MYTFAFMRNENTIGATTPQTSRPTSDGAGDWSVITAGSVLYTKIDEASADDGTTYIGSDKVVDQQEQIIGMEALLEPDTHLLTKIQLRYKRRGSDSSTQNFKVYTDGVVQGSKNIPNDSDWHDWTITLSEAESEALNWGTEIQITLRKSSSTYTRGVYVTQLYMTTEQ